MSDEIYDFGACKKSLILLIYFGYMSKSAIFFIYFKVYK